MADFPSLSRLPGFGIDPDGKIEDNVLRSPFESGYEHTRPRGTRIRRMWGLRYVLEQADLLLLRAFEQTTVRGGADAFNWAHPVEQTGVFLTAEDTETLTTELGEPIADEESVGASYYVRFASPIEVSYFAPNLWLAAFQLKEV